MTENNRPAPNKNNRIQRNFNQAGCGNFNREGCNGNYDQRPNFENSNRGTGRGANRNYHSQYQDGPKSTKWDAQFQAYGIGGKAVLEALKLTAYTILRDNGPEADYSRQLAQYNPNLREKFNARQDTVNQAQKEGKATAKEIAEAFSTITGQEICEEEVSLIQDIQLPEDEESDLTKDVEALEGDTNSK